MSYIMGMDPGFGNFKLWSKRGGTVYAARVSRAAGRSFHDSLGMSDTANDAEAIEFEGNRYYTGDYAAYKGVSIDNLGFERLLGSAEIKALFYSTLTQHMQLGAIKEPLSIQCGLPFGLMESTKFADTEKSMRDWLVGSHMWKIGNKRYTATVADVTVKSQAVGALLDFALNLNGGITEGAGARLKQEIGVLSIGHNTVEIMALSNSRLIENLTSEDRLGVRRLLDLLNRDGLYKSSELDIKLRENRMNGQLPGALSSWGEMVCSYIDSTWSRTWRRFEKVIIVGGGAMLLREPMQNFFEGKAYIPDNPIESIARGLYKRGVADAQKKSK
jgi:hypothetical protein